MVMSYGTVAYGVKFLNKSESSDTPNLIPAGVIYTDT